MMDRPSWDEYFMQIARVVATRATCPRRSVGAVIVYERRMLTTGYNGAPRELKHCPPDGPLHDWPRGCMMNGHCVRAVHAEQNAIVQAALNGVSTRGATLYVTCQPCNGCAKMIVNAGITKVVFDGDYPDEFAMEVFREAGLTVVRLSGTGAGSEEKLL